jgi:hypothetical protein
MIPGMAAGATVGEVSEIEIEFHHAPPSIAEVCVHSRARGTIRP